MLERKLGMEFPLTQAVIRKAKSEKNTARKRESANQRQKTEVPDCH